MNTSVSILKQLVAFDTTSRNSNLALIEWAAEFLKSRGASVEMLYNASRNKANLLASIGPSRPGGVVLSGHTDVVPVDGQEWSSDPFKLAERDGRLYGRGSSDMKGFIACSLAAAEQWKSAQLQRPLHFAFSYDEEVGCFGAHSLVERIAGSLPTPAFAIIGEPTDMKIGVAHNGVTGSHTRFRGVAAHASDPSLGVNAIDAAAAFVRQLHKVAHQPEVADNDCTLNVGQIGGGTATNIVAERCSVHWEYRAARPQDAAAVRETISDYLKSADFSALNVSTEVELDVPQFSSRLDEKWLKFLADCGAELPPITVPFGSEAGIFERNRIPSVVCGPGSIDQAHRPDEWIALSALKEADLFLSKLGAWASQTAPD